jgi:Bacterial Ig-like domain
MKRILLFFLVCFTLTRFPLITGCANIVPPTGGPRDSLPPVLIKGLPSPNSLHIEPNKIVLNFDEYIDLKDIHKNLLVSPVPKIFPTVRSHLKTITIEIRDTLQPNTTYSFNFGKAVTDVNEGNILKNYTYTFSTGGYIDSLQYSGRVIMASTGKPDSTLVAILHADLTDSAVAKKRPRYIARLDSAGNFTFRFLKPGKYALYALADESGTHEYTTKAQIFAFADSPVDLTQNTLPLLLYAYADTSNANSKKPKPLLNTPPKKTKEDKDKVKRLVLTGNLPGGQLDLHQQLVISFGEPVKYVDTAKIRFTRDSFLNVTQYQIVIDSQMKKMTLTYAWKENTPYHLILQKDFAEDTLGEKLLKIDTVSFKTKKEADYGNLRLRFKNLDISRHPVVIFYQGDKIMMSSPIGKSMRYNNKLVDPGEYELRVLYDTNKNGVWDPGDFWTHRQPEIEVPVRQKLAVKANWDNEVDITL